LKLLTVDASAAAAWLLPDESSAQADALYEQALSKQLQLQAPGLWAWEMGNLLHMARRRERITSSALGHALAVLQRAQVHLEPAPDEARMLATLALSAKMALTYYDASYLEQALRTGAQLATQDAALRRAATQAGVACVPL
jgi:predicted nucleic acid-binding protein